MGQRSAIPLLLCGDPSHINGPGLKGNGEPCENKCSPGHTRCHMHGGHTPQALVKAKSQLALLRTPAIEALYQVMEQLSMLIMQYQANTCAACGNPKGDEKERDVMIKACARLAQTCGLVLDRTDLGPKATLEIKQSDIDLDLKQLNPREQERMDEILANWEALKADHNQRLHVVAFDQLPEDPEAPLSLNPPTTH